MFALFFTYQLLNVFVNRYIVWIKACRFVKGKLESEVLKHGLSISEWMCGIVCDVTEYHHTKNFVSQYVRRRSTKLITFTWMTGSINLCIFGVFCEYPVCSWCCDFFNQDLFWWSNSVKFCWTESDILSWSADKFDVSF